MENSSWILDLHLILIYIFFPHSPTFQQALVVMLGADVGQPPHAPEHRSVSAPVVAVEASKQFSAYVETSVRKKSVLASGSEDSV